MDQWRVKLPPDVRSPFTVYVNGVQQRLGPDYEVRDGALYFRRQLIKEGKLGFWKWFLGAWGIGQYGRNDEVDVAWSIDGAPRVAHALEIEPPASVAT
jgi:hypothetical protein